MGLWSMTYIIWSFKITSLSAQNISPSQTLTCYREAPGSVPNDFMVDEIAVEYIFARASLVFPS
jgi:hypothetical protein